MELQIFSSLVTDSRQETNKKYSIDAMMLMIISAVLCDQCESPDDIRDFVNYNIDWFKKQINIEKAPSRETLRAFISCVNPEELMKCFDAFIKTQNFELSEDCVAIDGKTMKGTHTNGKDALHIVSAWSTKYGITLSCLSSKAKKNEVKAMDEIIDLLGQSGMTFSMDAMGCTKALAKRIRSKEAHYVLQLKGNQPYLKEQVEFQYRNAQAEHDTYVETNKGHGREETRRYIHFTIEDWIPTLFQWEGLKSIVFVERSVSKNGILTESTAWYISSIEELNAEKMASIVRGHWQVENNLHWTLDVVLRDDACRYDKANSAFNISILRRLVMNMYKSDSSKRRLKSKIAQARYDEDYREKLLFG